MDIGQETRMKIIHMTDSHISCKKEFSDNRLLAMLEHVKRYHPDAEFIIHTGDITDEGDLESYETIYRAIQQCGIPFYAVLGNHDSRHNYQKAFNGMDNGSDGDIEKTFQQYSVESSQGVFIFLDTLEEGREYGTLCLSRLSWLKNELETNHERPVFVVMHHPPLDLFMPRMDEINLENSDLLFDVLMSHGDIRHIFFGHVHASVHGSCKGIPFSSLVGDSFEIDLWTVATEILCRTTDLYYYDTIFIKPDSVVVHNQFCS
jgi:3',5'-cyclic-AMP phosphodiesterase